MCSGCGKSRAQIMKSSPTRQAYTPKKETMGRAIAGATSTGSAFGTPKVRSLTFSKRT